MNSNVLLSTLQQIFCASTVGQVSQFRDSQVLGTWDRV